MKPFFLTGTRGDLFCILDQPDGSEARGGLLFIHPFGDEMNKSRRMVALQSRALARQGWAVLRMDLLGCGDSAGDFDNASLAIWQADVELCCNWLAAQTGKPTVLWGLRFGALLGAAVVASHNIQCPRVLFWQPMLNGKQMLSTLLRQRAVAQVGSQQAEEGVGQLRKRLSGGETLELSGYSVSAQMAQEMEAAELDFASNMPQLVHWIDVVRSVPKSMLGAGPRLRQTWEQGGTDVRYQSVTGDPFWNAGEIVECQELIDKTCLELT